MQLDTLRGYLLQLTRSDAAAREAARAALLVEDEDIVAPLVAEFHAGVSEALGVAIISLVGEIGGPDALTLLRYVYHFEDKRPAWQRAAREALLYNQHNLDSTELEDLRSSD